MPDSSVLHEFLVSIGFNVNESSKARYDAAIATGVAGADAYRKTVADVGKQLGILGNELVQFADRPTRLTNEAQNKLRVGHEALTKELKVGAVAVTSMAASFVAGYTAIARQYESLYYIAQRTGQSATQLGGMRFGGPQIGLDAQALEQQQRAFSQLIQSSPGMAALARNLGAVNGNMLSLWRSLSQSGMPEWYQKARVEQMGGNWESFQNYTNPDNLRRFDAAVAEHDKRLSDARVSQERLDEASEQYLNDLRTMWDAMETVGKQAFVNSFGVVDGLTVKVKEAADWLTRWNAAPGHENYAAAEFAIATVGAVEVATHLRSIMRLVRALTGARAIITVGLVYEGYKTLTGGPGSGRTEPSNFSDWSKFLDLRYITRAITGHLRASGAAPDANALAPPHFQHGGLVDSDQLAMVHKREMVLPPELSDFIIAGASAVRGGVGAGAAAGGLKEWLSGSSAYLPFVRIVGFDPTNNFGQQGTGGGGAGPPGSPAGSPHGQQPTGALRVQQHADVASPLGNFRPNPRSTIPQVPSGAAPPLAASVQETIANSGLSPESQQLIRNIAAKEAHGFDVLAGGGHFDTQTPNRPGYEGFPQWGGYLHPYHGRMVRSHGAGLFQFEPGTWKAIAEKHGLTDFRDPRQQVLGAEYMLHDLYAKDTGGRDLEADLKAHAIDPRGFRSQLSRNTWAALQSGSWQKGLDGAALTAGPTAIHHDAGDRHLTQHHTSHVHLHGNADENAGRRIASHLNREAGWMVANAKSVIS